MPRALQWCQGGGHFNMSGVPLYAEVGRFNWVALCSLTHTRTLAHLHARTLTDSHTHRLTDSHTLTLSLTQQRVFI